MIEPSRNPRLRDDSAVGRTFLTESGSKLPIMKAIEHGPLVLDAGLGTRLLERGLVLGCDDPALWSLTRPALVEAIHRRDIAAGSNAVLTNTFGANRCWLKRFGREGDVEMINRQAVRLARRAAGPLRYVIGDIGPSAALEPGAAAEQTATLIAAHVDALLLETYRFPDVKPVLAEVTRSLSGSIPLLVSLWQWPEPAALIAQSLIDLGASVIGMNCQPGIEAAIAFAEEMDRRLGCPLLIKPSARGIPCSDDSPSSFAQAVPRLVDCNVRLLGGCCGTSEVHVAALADACARLERRPVPSQHGGLS